MTAFRSAIRRWLSLPTLTVEETAVPVAQLTILAWASAAVFTIVLAGRIVALPAHTWRWLTMLFAIDAGCAATVLLAKRGRVRLAGALLVLGMWITVTVMTVTAGGLQARSAWGYFVVVFVAGILFGHTVCVFTAFGCILTTLGIAVAEMRGALPPATAEPSTLDFWIANTLYLLVVICLQILASRAIRHASRKAEQELRERREAEALLSASENQVRRLIEHMSDGILHIDEHGCIVEVNPALERMTGYDREQLVGSMIWDLSIGLALVEQDTSEPCLSVQSLWLHGLATGQAPFLQTVIEVPFLCPNGSQRLLSVTYFPVATHMGFRITGVARDITEQRRAEEEAHMDQRRLDSLLRISQKGGGPLRELLDYALDEAVALSGSRFGFLFRYSEETQQFHAHAWSRHVGEECPIQDPASVNRAEHVGIWAEVVRQRKPIVMNDFPAPNPLKKGLPGSHAALFRLMAIPLILDGRVVAVVGVANKDTDYSDLDVRELSLMMETIWEIAERRQAQEALEESEKRFRVMFDNAGIAVALIETDGRLIEANAAYQRMTGYSDAELASMSYLDITHPEDSVKQQALLEDLKQGQLDGFQMEKRYAVKDGGVAWCSLTSTVARDATGRPQYVVAMAEDITARKRAEAVRERLAAIMEATPDLVCIVDRQGRLVYMNHSGRTMLGIDIRSDITQWNASDFWSDSARGQTLTGILESAIHRGPWQGETTVSSVEGHAIPVSLVAFAHRDALDDDAYLCVLARDITEQRQRDAAMLQTQRLESIGILAGGIAHDFNNLLTAILTQSSMALDRLDPSHPAGQHIEKAIRSSRQAAGLTRQLLAYAGKGQTDIRMVGLNQLIEENAALLAAMLPKNVVLDLALAPSLPETAADSAQLQQVLMNLLINAAEAMPEHGGTIDVCTTSGRIPVVKEAGSFVGLAVPKPGDYICLSVKDSGKGMDQQTLERIFDPFFTTKSTGRGLGLSALLGIVRSHKGGVQVTSVPGQGTEFKVYLPAISRDAQPASESIPAPTVETEAGDVQNAPQHGAILVVDDEEYLREALTDILEMAGYGVITAKDGREAVERYAALHSEIGLVILDLLMPVMGGEETLKVLRDLNPGIKVILTSGYDESEASLRFQSNSVSEVPTDFLPKPYDMETILAKVRTVQALG